MAVTACTDLDEGSDLDDESEPLVARGLVVDEVSGDGASLVYEQFVEYDAHGLLVDARAAGVELDEAMRERVARPYRHMDEAEILEDEAWVEVTKDGHTRHGYRVWSRPNENPVEPQAVSGPPVLDHTAGGLLDSEWGPEELHSFTAFIAGMPEWDLPLPVEPALNSDEAVATNKAARLQRAAERAELFQDLVGDLVSKIETSGGQVRMSNPVTGWMIVEGPQETLAALAAHDSVSLVSLADEDPEAIDYGWALGEGGSDARSDWDDYHDRGYTGDTGGATGDNMRVAIIEHTAVRDTACGFKDGPGCTGLSRFDGLYDCETNGVNNNPANEGTGSGICLWGPGIPACCSETSPYPTATTRGGGSHYDYGHGNKVSSIVGADYTEHQGDGHQLGDSPWASSTCAVNSDCSPGLTCAAGKCRHSSTWEASATGVAPDADMLFFGRASTSAAKAHAVFSVLVLDDADVISFSQGTHQERCDPRADVATEAEAENAYDDGKLFVACGGNIDASDPDSCSSASCGAWSPGSQAKTLSITRFDASAASCEADFADCERPNSSQCDGGADVSVDGTTHSGAGSIMDLVAPSNITHMTDESSTAPADGEVGGSFGGCSAATPHVSGMAALLKEYFVDTGAGWIGYPGRLQTLMLLMGDRSYLSGSTIVTRTTRADNEWGLGRLKARFFGATSESAGIGVAVAENSWAAGSTATYTWRPFGTPGVSGKTPLPGDTVMVKCVMHQAEDFSSEASDTVSVSNINLRVRISPTNSSGRCPTSPVSTIMSRTDSGRDWKSHVTILDSDVSGGLAGKCVYVQRLASFVDVGGISATTACYYAAEYDDQG